MKNVRLAIFGSFGNMDIGDEAMLTEDLDFVRNTLGIPNRNITLIGMQPEYLAYYHDHPRALCLPDGHFTRPYRISGESPVQKVRRFVDAAKNHKRWTVPVTMALDRSDAVLITGGGTVNSRDALGASLLRMHAFVRMAHLRRKPIFMSGQTIGPLGLFPKHDALAKEIIRSVDVLTTRDQLYSKRYMSIIGAQPRELIETFDDAYTLPHEDAELPEEVSRFLAGGDTVALNITDYTSDTQEKRRFIAELVEYLVRDQKSRVVLVSHTPKDFTTLHVIYDMVSNQLKPEVYIPDTRRWRDKVLKKLLASCKLAIGGRYHFIVFAGTSDTPFIGMAGNHYSYIKQDGFARMIGLEDWILTEKETWNRDLLHKRIEEGLRLKLNAKDQFRRPSVSMKRFGEWLQEVAPNR